MNATSPVERCKRLQNLVSDFDKLVFGEFYVLHFLGLVDRKQARVVRFRDNVHLPCLWAEDGVFTAVNDLAEVVAAL